VGKFPRGGHRLGGANSPTLATDCGGQRQLWGIVGRANRYPRRQIDRACAQALAEGVPSDRTVKALTERLVDEALARIDDPATEPAAPDRLTQCHRLIRPAETYADLFTRSAQQHTEAGTEPYPVTEEERSAP